MIVIVPISGQIPQFLENVCVSVVLELKEMGLWSGITLVYLILSITGELGKNTCNFTIKTLGTHS
jgi:hypothetical protein